MLEKVVSSARLKTDPIARQIIDHLSQKEAVLGLGNCVVYYDFPLFRDYEDILYQPTLMLLSDKKGVISIRVAGTQFDIPLEDERLSELYSIVFSKLLNSKRLRESRTALKIPLTSVLYLPPGSDPKQIESENTVVASLEGLSHALMALPSKELDDETMQEARSVIEGVKALSRPANREMSLDGSKPKALVLRKLEEEIANFDSSQRTAALTVPIGPQRIRGLAGSGKTIVLAWKAAYLHMQAPDKKILFTFYTRSLYETIRRQITRFYRHFRDTDPNWENLHVLHAWGGRRTAGVYYNACMDHGIHARQWGEVRNVAQAFKFVCEDLQKKTAISPKYDMVLVDEAQDLPDAFFRLLFALTHVDRDDKTIIWAYDELQSIFEPQMRSARELFGVATDGLANIDLDRATAKHELGQYASNDIILKKCYRNPLEILVCSHALGLGIYGDSIVQMLQNKEHWEDVGYEVEEGAFSEGSATKIVRPQKNSPLSIHKYEAAEEIVKWHQAPSFRDELDWIVAEAQQLISQGLSPEDILVICLDDLNAKRYFEALSERFAQASIRTNDVLANPFSTPRFQVEGSVTLSTVHRAKGNEAPVVFVAGMDAVAGGRNGRRARNRIFTAFTRTKCWLRVSGLEAAEPLFRELKTALENSPRLIFGWPNLKTVETLQRDVSRVEERMRKAREKYLQEISELGYSEEDAQLLLGQEKTE